MVKSNDSWSANFPGQFSLSQINFQTILIYCPSSRNNLFSSESELQGSWSSNSRRLRNFWLCSLEARGPAYGGGQTAKLFSIQWRDGEGSGGEKKNSLLRESRPLNQPSPQTPRRTKKGKFTRLMTLVLFKTTRLMLVSPFRVVRSFNRKRYLK